MAKAINKSKLGNWIRIKDGSVAINLDQVARIEVTSSGSVRLFYVGPLTEHQAITGDEAKLLLAHLEMNDLALMVPPKSQHSVKSDMRGDPRDPH